MFFWSQGLLCLFWINLKLSTLDWIELSHLRPPLIVSIKLTKRILTKLNHVSPNKIQTWCIILREKPRLCCGTVTRRKALLALFSILSFHWALYQSVQINSTKPVEHVSKLLKVFIVSNPLLALWWNSFSVWPITSRLWVVQT